MALDAGAPDSIAVLRDGVLDAAGRWGTHRIAVVRKLIAVVAIGGLWLLLESSVLATRVGSIGETALGPSQAIYLFGLTAGPDGNLGSPTSVARGSAAARWAGSRRWGAWSNFGTAWRPAVFRSRS
jgi:hypothetical protein